MRRHSHAATTEVRGYRPGQLMGMAAGGAALGAAGGAAIGSALRRIGPVKGALIGGALMGLGEPVTSLTKPAGAVKPVAWRILASAFPGALAGATLNALARRPAPIAVGAISGAGAGAVGMNLRKVILGGAVGAGVGAALSRIAPGLGGAAVSASSVVAFRVLSSILWRDQSQLDLMGERVPEEHVPYVVPFRSDRSYVGGDYLEELATRTGGRFERNPADIGILPSLALLDGPTFDPARVNPLIHEFYAHTSRFTLDIVPERDPLVVPAYWLYRSVIAKPLGQANIPANTREAQRGMNSWIDTLEADDGDGVIRTWVRTFADSGEPIYVGIYTALRHEDIGYVSVGFPIPQSNFTVTLQPYNAGEDGLLLSSESDRPFPGHYLSAFDKRDGSLSVVKLNTMGEAVHVYVRDGDLFTDHRFSLWGRDFLTLRYRMTRAPTQP